jgi:hypothetical protein
MSRRGVGNGGGTIGSIATTAFTTAIAANRNDVPEAGALCAGLDVFGY